MSMSMRLWIGLLAVVLPLFSAGPRAQQDDLVGHWQRAGGEPLGLSFWPQVCVLEFRDRVLVHGLEYGPAAVSVQREAEREQWTWKVEGGDLVLEWPAGKETFRRVEGAVPAARAHEPLRLGAAQKLADERVAKIAAELESRRAEDQAVRTEGARAGDMARVDAENRDWLRRLISEVGWIDVERFGDEASDAAFLIVQHSGDTPLMFAALPRVEHDVRAKRLDAQAYCLLYDRLQLQLAKKQRYGSQMRFDGLGSLYLQPVQDPSRVDALRAQMGLMPLAEYLAFVERSTGKKVKRLTPGR